MKLIFVLLGIILGIISFFSPGAVFIFSVFIISLMLLNRLPDKRRRRFLLILFSTAFLLRVVFVLLVAFFAIVSGHILNYALSANCPDYSTPYIFGDSGYYTLRGLFTKMCWMGEPLSSVTLKEYVTISYGFTGFINVLAVFFSLFGYSPVSSSLINSFLGAITVILVYDTVDNIFGEKPARLAAVLTAFFPSLFLWSITNLKETSMIFATSVFLWSMVKYNIARKFYYPLIAILAVLGHFYMRPGLGIEFIIIAVFLILVYVFYPYLRSLYKRCLIIFFPALVIVLAVSTLLFFRRGVMDKLMEKVYTVHRGVVNTGGICYKLLPDDFYGDGKDIQFADFSKMFIKGWFHIIFEPLPGRITQSKSMLFIFPQVFLWYFLIPFFILGIAIALRYKLKGSTFIITYFFIMTSILAVTGGNVGTIFRLREVNTPIVLIFSSVGLYNTFKIKIRDKKNLI